MNNTYLDLRGILREMLNESTGDKYVSRISDILKKEKGSLTSDDMNIINKIKSAKSDMDIINLVVELSNLPDNDNKKIASKLEKIVDEL